MSITVLVVALIVALVVFGLAAAVVGRIPGLVPLEPDNQGVGLPPGPFVAEDLPRVRFSLALRGYRMSEVDEFVARVQNQMTSVETQEPSWSQRPEVQEFQEPRDRSAFSPSPSTFEPPPS